MTAFVESCVETVADTAVAVERNSRGRPRAKRLLRVLDGKKNILITTHVHPDPDALASSLALCNLLNAKLKDAKISMSIKGQIGGGINEMFVRESKINPLPWDEANLRRFDAIILLDTQPGLSYSPLPDHIEPTAVIDHHRSRGRRPHCAFCDIRTDVGATASIIFSYFMELEVDISADLSATLLYAIESDVAGPTGTPSDLDNVALSSLTLTANTNKLYRMRYVALPQSYYMAYASGLNNALCYSNALFSHLDSMDSLEQPAVIADFLLRYDQVQYALVTAVYESRLVLSLRSSAPKASAADLMRRLVRRIGEGGGHRTKAGGFVPLQNGTPTEIERVREMLRRRYLRALGIKAVRGQRLVPKMDSKPQPAASANGK